MASGVKSIPVILQFLVMPTKYSNVPVTILMYVEQDALTAQRNL
jgi:hypothetical protein